MLAHCLSVYARRLTARAHAAVMRVMCSLDAATCTRHSALTSRHAAAVVVFLFLVVIVVVILGTFVKQNLT